MQHQVIFAEKFLNIKMGTYELDKEIKDLADKKAVIQSEHFLNIKNINL